MSRDNEDGGGGFDVDGIREGREVLGEFGVILVAKYRQWSTSMCDV